MAIALIFLRLVRDLFFIAGGGWVAICLGVGLARMIAARLLELLYRPAKAVFRASPATAEPIRLRAVLGDSPPKQTTQKPPASLNHSRRSSPTSSESFRMKATAPTATAKLRVD